MANRIDIFTNTWCDIVFEGRNKEYGAYQLRKAGPKNIARGILLSLVIVAILIAIPIIKNLISDIADNLQDVKVTEVQTLAPPPPIDETTPPPPPVEPPPPLKSTVKFTPPVIKPDEEVPADEPPPTQEEMKEVDAGSKTVEGDANGVPAGLEGDGNVEEAPQIFTVVEEQPEFPGGEAALNEFLSKHLSYPPMARENGISGRVFLNFIIDPSGKISNIKILRGIGGGCEEEAVRVVKSMPNWKPGRQNGRSVNVSFNLPIKFTLR